MYEAAQKSDEADDATLIKRTLGGQTSAYESLIRRYQDRLFHSLGRVLRNRADAEDVVQEAFVKAYVKLNTFKAESQFYTWLYRIAHNLAISNLRKQKTRNRTVSLDADEGQGAMRVVGKESAPSARLEQQEQNDHVLAALNGLSGEHRSVLVLREMDGLDYDAISQVLDVPVGTVRSRLARARQSLREQLERTMTHDSTKLS